MDNKKRFDGLDALKAIAAFLVVCIHSPFPGEFGRIFDDFCVLAVPSFFMISGFFYPRTLEKGGENRQIKHIAKITFISLAAYFVWTWIFYRWTGQDFAYVTDRLFSLKGIIKFLFFHMPPHFGYHLWYMLCFLWVLIIVKTVNKLRLKKLLMCCVPLLFLPGMALGRYSDIFVGQFVSIEFSRNCIFLGVPFFCAGWYIGENFESIKQRLSKKLLIAAIVFFALMGPMERYILQYFGRNAEGDMFISTPFFVISTFLYFAAFSNGGRRISAFGRKYSAGVYFVHVVVLDIVYDIVSKTALVGLYPYAAPIVVFLLSFAVVWLWKKLPVKGARSHV